MISRLYLSTATACMLAIASPLSAQEENAASADQALSADTVVATVGDTDITLGHMIVLRSRLPAQYQQLPPEALFEGVLDQLVQQTLLGQQLETLSAGSKASLENEERALKASEVIQELVADAVSVEALQAAYDERFEGVEPGKEYNASHILVESQEEATALIGELEGGADFAELAKENSTGPSGPNGGQLGWFGEGAMVPDFETAVVGLEPGQISEPVQTQFGWHVIRLNETRDAELPTLDDLRSELTQQIQLAAIQAKVDELKGTTEISTEGAEAIDPAALNDLSILED